MYADMAHQVHAEQTMRIYTAHARVCGAPQSAFAGQQLTHDGQQGVLKVCFCAYIVHKASCNIAYAM